MSKVIEVISTRELTEDECFADVLVVSINPKKASNILLKLAEYVPLESYNLEHLKRVRRVRNSEGELPVEFIDEITGEKATYPFRLQVLLCPVHAYSAATSASVDGTANGGISVVRSLLNLDATNENVAQLQALGQVQCMKVCRVSPETRKEFDEWNVIWPTVFRADHLTRERDKGPTHSLQEEENIRRYMGLVRADGKACVDMIAAVTSTSMTTTRRSEQVGQKRAVDDPPPTSSTTSRCASHLPEEDDDELNKDDITLFSGAIVVNPVNGQVISRSVDFYLFYKRQIETKVQARAQGASSGTEPNDEKDEWRRVLQNPLMSPTMRCIEMVAAVVRGDVLMPTVPLPLSVAGTGIVTDIDSATFMEEQYLCTDMDLYVDIEPDMMACMALVHSRIRRVYFLKEHIQGALSTHTHIHEMRCLNHRYRAFHCKGLADEDV